MTASKQPKDKRETRQEDAIGDESLPADLGIDPPDITQEDSLTQGRPQQGVLSLETGLGMLDVFNQSPGPLRLTEIAKMANVHPSKAHRYLVSLVRKGYVTQDAVGSYRLGPGALRTGLSYLAQADFVQLVNPLVNELSVVVNNTAFAAIWSTSGPLMLNARGPWSPVVVNVRIGSVLPVLSSAAGRVFVAYMEPAVTRPVVEAELRLARDSAERAWPSTMDEVEQLRMQVRKDGVGVVRGDFVPGVNSVCAPVFNHQGDLVVVIGVVGTERAFDESAMQRATGLLAQKTQIVSSQLGYTPVTARPA